MIFGETLVEQKSDIKRIVSKSTESKNPAVPTNCGVMNLIESILVTMAGFKPATS